MIEFTTMKPLDKLQEEMIALPVDAQLDLLDRIAVASAPVEPLDEEPDSVKEALRGDAEMKADPSIAMTWDQSGLRR